MALREVKEKSARMGQKLQKLHGEDWSNVLWSDESNFEVLSTPCATYVRRRVGEKFNPGLVPIVKHGGGSIMIWGCQWRGENDIM